MKNRVRTTLKKDMSGVPFKNKDQYYPEDFILDMDYQDGKRGDILKSILRSIPCLLRTTGEIELIDPTTLKLPAVYGIVEDADLVVRDVLMPAMEEYRPSLSNEGLNYVVIDYECKEINTVAYPTRAKVYAADTYAWANEDSFNILITNDPLAIVGKLCIGSFYVTGAAITSVGFNGRSPIAQFNMDAIQINGTAAAIFDVNAFEEATGLTPDLTGFRVPRGSISGLVFAYKKDNVAPYAGPQDAMQPLAYREEDPVNNAVAFWNDSLGRFVTDSRLRFDGTTLTIDANFVVTGSSTNASVGNLEVSDNFIIVNNGETGAGVTVGIAGVKVDRGTATDYIFAFEETTDTFRIGAEGDLQAVATRNDSMNDLAIAYWDNTNKKFISSPDMTFNPTTKELTVNGVVLTGYVWNSETDKVLNANFIYKGKTLPKIWVE